MDPTDYEYDEEMRCAAEFLLDEGILEGATEGIAKQITSKGWAKLTSRQQEVFIEYALPKAQRDCKRCHGEIPLTELGVGGDYCSWCDHQIDKGN